MYKILLIATLLFIAGCANNQSKTETQATDPHPTVNTQQANLQLNNGQKWKLDDATRQNMNDIKAYIAQATHANGELSGQELQKKGRQAGKRVPNERC